MYTEFTLPYRQPQNKLQTNNKLIALCNEVHLTRRILPEIKLHTKVMKQTG